MIAQCQFESSGFDAVVHLGRSSMQAHILNIFVSEFSFLECERNSAGGFFRRIAHPNAMKRFASRAVAGDLSINLCTARFGVFVVFEDEHPRTFGEDEAVAIGGKGT